MSALEQDPQPEVELAPDSGLSRRELLVRSGALVLAFATPVYLKPARALAADAAVPFPVVPPNALSSWIAVDLQGKVTAFTGRVDLGQGNRTAYAQVVAEELDVALENVEVLMGDTALTVDQGITAASSTVRNGIPSMRQAAADARAALLALASPKLGVPASALSVENGVIKGGSGQIGYGELLQGAPLTGPITARSGTAVTGPAPIKNYRDYKVVGTSAPRLDIEPKVRGTFTWIQDVKLPGMVHARVIRPAGLGSTIESVGPAPKGVQVVRIQDFLAVVADDEWTAIKAAENLKVTWSKWVGTPVTGDVWPLLRRTPVSDRVFASKGTLSAGQAKAAKTLKATYQMPIETHGSIGPSCAVADVKPDQAVIYSGTQGPHNLLAGIAPILQMPSTSIRIIQHDASGCYGRNGADPAAVDAALISQAIGKPVRVQWMRQDEHGWDPKGPATVQDLMGGLDAQGNLVVWNHEAWIPPEFDSTVISSVLAGRAKRTVSLGSWSGPMVYNIPNFVQLSHAQHAIGSDAANGVGLITAWLRSPGQYQISFGMESFIDELAAEAAVDPVEFRLRYLTDQRMIDVLQAATRMAKWETRPSPAPSAKSTDELAVGRGVGISLRDGTYNADVAEVEVNRKTGKVRVRHWWLAQDSGLVINPRTTKRQMSTGVTQTTSRALLEEVTLNGSTVTSTDWHTYPILRFKDAPSIHTMLLNHPELPATGAGEGACCPVAAAIGNAIFDATGVRIRDLPFRPKRVKAALAAAASA
jgi:CO/xanthine dehydrogenase Mo-binding subunit